MIRGILLGLLVVVSAVAVLIFYQRRKQDELDQTLQAAEVLIRLDHGQQAEQILLGAQHDATRWWAGAANRTALANLLGMAYFKQHMYVEAEPRLKQGLELSRKNYPPLSVEIAWSEFNLAMLYRDEARYDLAEPLLLDAMGTFQGLPVVPRKELGQAQHNLASIYREQGHIDNAEAFLKTAIENYKQSIGPRDPQTADAEVQLGLLYSDAHRLDQAEPFLREALAVQTVVLKPQDPNLIATLNELAWIYSEEHHDADAAALQARVKDIARASKASGAKLEPVSILSLARTLDMGHDIQDAETYYREAVSAYADSMAPEHPATAAVLDYLGEFYIGQRRMDDAELPLQRALAIQQLALGTASTEAARSKSDLALVYYFQSKFDQGEIMAKQALPVLEASHGPDSLEVSTVLNRLGLAEDGLGKLQDAEAALSRALAIRERKLGPDDDWVALSLNNLAGVYVD